MSRGYSSDTGRILVAQALRAFGYGFGAVLLGVTLHERGWSSVRAGLVLTAVVAGTVTAQLVLARQGDRWGRRRCYVGLYGVLAVVWRWFRTIPLAPQGAIPIATLASEETA